MQCDYQFKVSESVEDCEWDDFVASTPGGHHVQSSCWGRVKSTVGWRTVRICVQLQGRIVAGAQLLVRGIPLAGSIAYVTKGPLLASADPALAKIILQKVRELAQARHCRFLAIQPPNNGEYLCQLLEESGFRPSSLELSSTASLVIDLDQELQQIVEGLTRETRRNIGRSERAGIVVREGSAADLDSFYALHQVTASRQGFLPYRRDYFDAIWNAFAPQGWGTLLLACYQEEIVSAQLLLTFGDLVMTKMIGWGGGHAKHYPNYALLWASILWAKNHGYRHFDFEGLDVEGARARIIGTATAVPGPDTFKYGFGGEVQLYPPSYVHLPNKVVSWLYHGVPRFIEKGERGRLVECLRKRTLLPSPVRGLIGKSPK